MLAHQYVHRGCVSQVRKNSHSDCLRCFPGSIKCMLLLLLPSITTYKLVYLSCHYRRNILSNWVISLLFRCPQIKPSKLNAVGVCDFLKSGKHCKKSWQKTGFPPQHFARIRHNTRNKSTPHGHQFSVLVYSAGMFPRFNEIPTTTATSTLTN